MKKIKLIEKFGNDDCTLYPDAQIRLCEISYVRLAAGFNPPIPKEWGINLSIFFIKTSPR